MPAQISFTYECACDMLFESWTASSWQGSKLRPYRLNPRGDAVRQQILHFSRDGTVTVRPGKSWRQRDDVNLRVSLAILLVRSPESLVHLSLPPGSSCSFGLVCLLVGGLSSTWTNPDRIDSRWHLLPEHLRRVKCKMGISLLLFVCQPAWDSSWKMGDLTFLHLVVML